MSKNNNFSQGFIFQDINISGNIVKLSDLYQDIIKRQKISGASAELLGQVLVIATMLIHRIKNNCELTIQFQSEANIKLLAVKVDSEGHLRAIINTDSELKEPLLGEGILVVTIRQLENNKQHQSTIAIKQGQTVCEAFTDYFAQSEQMPTLFHLVCHQQQVVGMLLQQAQELVDQEEWQTVTHLFATLSDKELLDLDSQTILTRLFNEYNLKLFDEKQLEFKCTCSLERMQNAIISIGEKEALDILKTDDVIEVTCEYCTSKYNFDLDAIKRLFTKH